MRAFSDQDGLPSGRIARRLSPLTPILFYQGRGSSCPSPNMETRKQRHWKGGNIGSSGFHRSSARSVGARAPNRPHPVHKHLLEGDLTVPFVGDSSGQGKISSDAFMPLPYRLLSPPCFGPARVQTGTWRTYSRAWTPTLTFQAKARKPSRRRRKWRQPRHRNLAALYSPSATTYTR